MATLVSSIPLGSFCYTPQMILTRDVILREIADGRLSIEPLEPDQIGPASIDLHLADEIRVMEGGPDVIQVTEDADYRTVTRVQCIDGSYVLRRGEKIHDLTRERVRRPPRSEGRRVGVEGSG